MQANNDGYRRLAMGDDGKTFWERIGLTSTRERDIVTPTTLNTVTRDGAPAPPSTGDTDVDAYLRQMQETTARAVEDKREGVDEVDYGKLLVGTARKGINQFAGGLTSTADWLIGQPLQAVGWKNNPVSLLNQEMKNEAALLSSTYDENAAKSIPAQLTNKYGPSVVAALPQAALAYFTAGSSLAAQGSTKGLQLASSAAQNSGLISTIANAARTMMSDLQFWLPVAQTAGTSYEQARMDGTDDLHASVYATVNSLVNGLIERGGGGIQELPAQLRSGNPSLIRAWVFSSLDEGKEEVVQGVVDRILQKLIYGKNNPLFSTTDENAIFNPRTMAEDAADGIAVGTILGGGQMIANNIVQSWNARQSGRKDKTFPATAADAYRLLYTERLLEQAKRNGNLYTQRLLQRQIEKALKNFELETSNDADTNTMAHLSQYEEDVRPPVEYDGDFEDFLDLKISNDEGKAFSVVWEASRKSGFEYGIVIEGGVIHDLVTSNLPNTVGVDLKNYGYGLTLLHSHTNATPLSIADFRMLLKEKVDRIGVVGYNGDAFVAYIGYGDRPTLEEFEEVARKIRREADLEMLNYPNFYDWTFAERNYMVIREQAFRIARHFGWTLEGGRLNVK